MRAGWAAWYASIAGIRAEEPADLVGARQEHLLGERVDVERHVLVARHVDQLRLRSTVSSMSGSAATQLEQMAWRSSSTTIGSRPFLSALLRKMSAKLVEMIARMPHATSAHGACSRDEPSPEVVAGQQDLPAGHRQAIHHESGLCWPPSASKRQSWKSASARPACRSS